MENFDQCEDFVELKRKLELQVTRDKQIKQIGTLVFLVNTLVNGISGSLMHNSTFFMVVDYITLIVFFGGSIVIMYMFYKSLAIVKKF